MSALAGGAQILDLRSFHDERGSLAVAEPDDGLPFPVRRLFWLFDLDEDHIRGAHANREIHELLVAVHGRISVTIEHRGREDRIDLVAPDVAIHVPPLVWVTVAARAPGTVVLVAASAPYDADDAVRDRAEFERLCAGG